jgi:hypothetical protein
MASENPYEPPTTGADQPSISTAIGKCPRCRQRIGYLQVAMATCPIWLTCSNCRAKLTGGLFVRAQAFVVLAMSAVVVALSLWLLWPSTTFSALLLIGTWFLILIPFALLNVWLTLKCGQYSCRL